MMTKDIRKKKLSAIISIWIVFSLILFTGCGGGGGDSPQGPATKEQLLRSIEATISALEQEAERGRALEKLSVASQLALIPDRDDIQLIPSDAQDECMTVETRNETTLLRFDGTVQCNGFSGTLEVTPVSGNNPEQGVYRNDIKLVDFSTGDGCPVNGETVSHLVVKENRFTDDNTYTSLNVCGDQYSGQVVFSGDTWETSQSDLSAQTYDYDENTKTQVDVLWQVDASTLDGKALATVDGHDLTDAVDQITFTDTCNLPEGGTLTIDDPNAETTVADFTDTSCENPEAAVTYQGSVEQWTLTAEKDPGDKEDPIVAGVKIIGDEEIVFDYSEDSCEKYDIPDSRACAYRDKNGKIQLISTHYINRKMVGETLDSVKRDCNVIMESHSDPDPSMYNDQEWITGTYTSDGSTVYALLHNESHGWKDPEQCPSGVKDNCLNLSISLAVSTDGGETFTHASAPNHLVATPPYPYEIDNSPAGYYGISNILLNSEDHWYYALFRAEEFELQKVGVCAMRTKDLSDPKSWRTWDGSGFNAQFVNPFEQDGFDPADHVCEPISVNNIGKVSGYISYNTFFNKYVLAGTGRAWDPDRKEAVPGFYFSLSDDLVNWSPLQLIMEVELWYTATQFEADRHNYASLIDPDDTSRNFSVTGQRPYLYFVRWNKNTNLDRDLIRIRLEFSK